VNVIKKRDFPKTAASSSLFLMARVIALFGLLLSGFATASIQDIDCSTPAGPSDNACTSQLPNCMNVASNVVIPSWKCRRCAANCDCPLGEYCSKTPGPDSGTCIAINSIGKIGAPCSAFGNGRVPILGMDDEMVCGLPIFSSVDGSFLTYEWLGDCRNGKCYECGGDAISWTIDLSFQLTPRVEKYDTADNASRGAWDGGSLVCDGRYCSAGIIFQSGSDDWFGEYYSSGLVGGICACVWILFVMILFAALAECRKRCSCCCGRRHTKSSTASTSSSSS
jgi:hypothetical protein